MGVGDPPSTTSIRSESSSNLSTLQRNALDQAIHQPNRNPPGSTFPTQATHSDSSTTRSRSSTITQNSRPTHAPTANYTAGSYAPVPQDQYARGHGQGDEASHPGENHANSDPGSIPPSPRLGPTQRSVLSFTDSRSGSPTRIKVRDLGHIQSFASEEVLTRSRRGSTTSLRGKKFFGQQYEISAMPVSDIIEMVAGLLTKITTTNDRQHEHLHRHVPPPEGSPGLSKEASSVLAFHGKNVPSISILAYLSRIHKYCPTTYEVFLSLLVYFDRMTEAINNGTLQVFSQEQHPKEPHAAPVNFDSSDSTRTLTGPATPPPSGTPEIMHTDANAVSQPDTDSDAYKLSHFFVVDSFNIHRLVIAGVTCASKFFSDVFYTNSRYAKVVSCHCRSRKIFLMIETGRWSTISGVEPFRATIPTPERLSPLRACGRS